MGLLRRVPVVRSLLRLRDDVSGIRTTLQQQTNEVRIQAQTRDLLRDVTVAQTVALRAAIETCATSILQSGKYEDPKRLNRYEGQVFSQNGEDGVISEIFHRIGTTNRVFVEIGCGAGLENNTTYRLMLGWSGYWFDGEGQNVSSANEAHREHLRAGRLVIGREFFTRDNASTLLDKYQVPREFDLLSLDVDRNTSWVWAALSQFRPRVAVIEYNASIPPQDDWEIEYDEMAQWDGTLHFGASLSALERIGRSMGYLLAACETTGVNAFFVREDQAGDKFSDPYTAVHHYEPPRYFLIRTWGHRRG